MEVVHVDRVRGDADSVFISGSMNDSRFYPGACHPRTERPMMVFTAFRIRRVIKGCSAKFRRPYHQRIFKQTAGLQILYQTGNGLVHISREPGMIHHVSVGIPVSR